MLTDLIGTEHHTKVLELFQKKLENLKHNITECLMRKHFEELMPDTPTKCMLLPSLWVMLPSGREVYAHFGKQESQGLQECDLTHLNR